jgi:hypothetical protein
VRGNTHVVLVTHITKKELQSRLSNSEIANGFANRFLWFFVKRTKLLANPPAIHISQQWTQWLTSSIVRAQTVREMQWTPDALRLWKHGGLYEETSRALGGLVGELNVRAAPYVIRLSMTYALLDGLSQVDVPHLTAAMVLWRYSLATCRWVWGDKTGDPVADRILESLAKVKRLTRNDIGEMFGGRNASQVQVALNLLLELRRVKKGKLTRKPGEKGRPVEVWEYVE